MKTFKFKKDAFSRSRGGKSSLLEIKCSHCDSTICFYQKDGPGELKRMYRDRIVAPVIDLNGDNLICQECGRLLATDSETFEKVVVYRALYGNYKLWVRSYKMFTEKVEGKGQEHRFGYIKIESVKK